MPVNQGFFEIINHFIRIRGYKQRNGGIPNEKIPRQISNIKEL